MDKLAAVPMAVAPLTRSTTVLPSSVDNSTQPYFRPLFQQSGLECGQASSIGLGLTYELDLKRNVPANVTQNQYATYFTYDFLNGGGDAGCSFLESWEIIKRCGNPTAFDYGGLSTGGASRWMTGYDKYYNAMHNRITDVAVMYLNTIEGLNMLRSWLYNHMDQASIGGVANFYSQFTSVTNQLPNGTPEAGKYVITTWGSSPNHAMTILGYNDSIRYDYNGDGQYTNNLDINGDGIINLKDWEIGGLKIANTYGTVYSWGNSGFSYAMYKSFADNPNSGGIWNNAVYISYAKQDLTPKLAMKVILKHNSRNKLSIKAGVSTNLSATEPDFTLNLPIFDYQGGDKYMQGGSTEADKTLEFGLDVTPLLSEITSGQPAKFFLSVQENDPANAATGQVVLFDLIDYTTGTVTIPGNFSNVPLVENGVTTLAITTTLIFNNPFITTNSLPEAKIYEPYSQQLSVSGGTSPYKWRMMVDYTENQGTGTYTPITGQTLSVNGNSSGYASQDLPFQFPFYGKNYTKVFPHVDGYIMFEDHPVPWPYIIYEKTFFRNNKCIAPYMAKPLVIDGGSPDGIWYQGNQDSAVFRWELSQSAGVSTTDINFSVTLFPDGRIKYQYGNITSFDYVKWISGISNGDGVNYHFSAITDSVVQPTANSSILYATQPFPTEMSISETGLFHGTPARSYVNLPLKFYVEDNNFLHTTKTLNFNTKGIEVSFAVNSGNDTLVEYGEITYLSPTLHNVSSIPLHNVVLNLSINDQYITLLDSTENIGTLNPGQTISIPNALMFSVSNLIPDKHAINLQNHIVCTEDNFNKTNQILARAASIAVTSVNVIDGNNNILMPGETASLNIKIKNLGGSAATGLAGALNAIDPYLTVLSGNLNPGTLLADSSATLNFQVQANANCPSPHIGLFMLNLSGDKSVQLHDSIFQAIGQIAEDFETGDYTRFPWSLSGNAYWNITNVSPYEGTFCSQSGTMIDNQECIMKVTFDVLSASEISFYRKVSSENNYDFLYFYIDGAEQGKWSGDVPWGKVAYSVSKGVHVFKWVYRKDYSVSTGSDKAWVDFIVWPPVRNYLLIANAGPDDIACSGQGYTLQGQTLNAAAVWWSTSGDGTFSMNNTPNAIYTPGANDLANGIVTLTIHATQGSLPPVTDAVQLNLTVGPVSNAGPDGIICPGASKLLSGTSASNYSSVLWSSNGDGTFDDPTQLSPTYTPGSTDLLIGSVNLLLSVFGNVNCNPAVDGMMLTFHPAVVTNAGTDQTIQYNTSAQLNGSASGGTGNFAASWEPSGLLVNPLSFTTATANLSASQVFTLTATNVSTGCLSTDEITVNVIGGPLAVTATATPGQICIGSSAQLNANGTGGSGVYTYSWTSDPAGFTSNLKDPWVNPTTTTIYTVTMNDGTASVSSQVTVMVSTFPSAPAKPQGPAAVNVMLTQYTQYSTILVTGNQYQWQMSPSEAGSIVPENNNCKIYWNSSFSGVASLWSTASNPCGTSTASEALQIIANSEVGMPEIAAADYSRIYPNPNKGQFQLLLPSAAEYKLTVADETGRIIHSETFTAQNSRLPQSIDLGDCAPGSYSFQLYSTNGIETGKLLVIK